jgi:hypothetical protein
VTRFRRVKKGTPIAPVMDTLQIALAYLTGLHFVATAPLDWPTLLGTGVLVNTCDAIVCRIVARNNGYPPRVWLGLGFVFGIWAIIVLMLAPKRS